MTADADHTAHDERVREQFARQAVTFDDRGFAAQGLEQLVDVAAPRAGDLVLDVAAGAGHVARVLAPHVGHVCALDLTPEMLRQGRDLAEAAGLTNLTWQVGDATALPWLDDTFDLVACRLTLHQVADPVGVVAEMVRVARPGGRVLVVDMVADDDPAVATETNRLERLRDPSHGRTLPEAESRRLLADAGARVVRRETRDQRLDLADWLRRTGAPSQVRAEVGDALQSELDGGTVTGLRPHRDDDGLGFTHTWLSLLAEVPRT